MTTHIQVHTHNNHVLKHWAIGVLVSLHTTLRAPLARLHLTRVQGASLIEHVSMLAELAPALLEGALYYSFTKCSKRKHAYTKEMSDAPTSSPHTTC